MKILFTAFALICTTYFSHAQKFTPVNKDSKISFTIKNFGINTKGSFSGLKGDITFSAQHPETSLFDVTVSAETIDTDNNMRDTHLKKEEYFNVEKYPDLHFKSSKITKTDATHFSVTGDLTIKDKTKQVSFPFTAEDNQNQLKLEGSFTIKRKDFDVGGSSAVLGDEVDISLNIIAAKSLLL